jgi:homoserine/homoserine lactone efflux protein|tara:strand:+ start:151 stop:762 length:612 start_codon:yes stop_codon:yes gene_type:complete
MLPLDYFLFLQIILFLFITPGTPRIVIISLSISFGVRNCVWVALGDVTANILQASLIIFLLHSFFIDNPNLLNFIKWIGVAYLFYLATDVYFSKVKNLKNVNSEKSRLSLFKDGFLVAGTSPKAWAFFPLIFPQFINFETNYVVQFLILIITYVVLDFLSLICYAFLANKLIDWLKANPKTINTISACVLFSIGVFIALTQQY